jgi:hypothetical protein
MPFTPKELDPDQHRLERREYQREWRRRNGGQKDRGYKFKHRYGITIEQYEAMVIQQQGKCAICDKPEAAKWKGTDRVRSLSVDHCHSTGRVRALLCHSCNRILGLLGDDVERLRRAVTYLEAH